MSELVSCDIINSDMDKREFKITIGIRSYWITKEELDKYLRERKNEGCEYVTLRNGLMVLPVKFQDIVHRSVIEDSEKIDGGRWQCETGTWHNANTECHCNTKMIETDDGTMLLEDSSAKTASREEKKNNSVSRYLTSSLKSF